MNKINSFLIRETILRTAPHRVFNKLANVAYCPPLRQTNNFGIESMKDQAFLEVFTFTNFCEYMTDPNFKISGFNLRQTQPSKFLSSSSSVSVLTQTRPQPKPVIQKRMIQIIRKLGKSNKARSIFTDAEETILMMSIEETKNNKKYLIYIYKWILSQSKWSQPEFESLGLQLSKVIEGKIIESCLNTEEKNKAERELDETRSRIKGRLELQAEKEKEKIEKVMQTYENKKEGMHQKQ